MSNTNPTIEMLPTAGLVPYARNSRTHSPEQVAQIAESIREFGFTNPVIVDAENGIIAGRASHGRAEAGAGKGAVHPPGLPDRITEANLHHRRQQTCAERRLGL